MDLQEAMAAAALAEEQKVAELEAEIGQHQVTSDRLRYHELQAARMRAEPGKSLRDAMVAKATVEATMTAAAASVAKEVAKAAWEDEQTGEDVAQWASEEAELASEAAQRARQVAADAQA
jgi:hypothetical protein